MRWRSRRTIDHMVLFSGDGDFRSLVEAMQRRGVRVTVVSTISTQPPMVADELRRQADVFLDIVELQSKIGRDPSERAPRAPRETARAAAASARAAHAAIPAAPRRAATRAARRATTSTTKTEASRDAAGAAPRQAEPPRDCPLCPRLVAFREEWRAQRAGLVQRAGPLVRAARRAAADRRARARPAGREPHRPAVHRRLCRRPALRDADRIRLRARQLRGAARRRARAGRRAHHQRGALRAAGEQADAGRDQDLPRCFLARRIAEMPKLRAIVALGRIAHEATLRGARRRSARPRRSGTAHGMRSASSRCSTAIIARATTRTPAC